ncbi:carbohydrate ABC transporter permease [Eubacteriales bacterium OttesenSCG-928-N13]|nr:carbohydrate ABC transporter permease [Eubacteriales bacterium OttesenSCG-928-N13]
MKNSQTVAKPASRGDRAFDVVNYILLGIVLFVTAYPLYYVLVASFSDPFKVYAGQTFLLPAGFSLSGYQRIFMDASIVKGYLNSLLYTVVGTSISVGLTCVSGYALSKKTLPGRRGMMLILLFTMYFNGGLIPTYLVVRDVGMFNTLWALVLPNAVSVYNLIIARTFFESNIPDSVLEAASIDGSSNTGTMLRIVMPLSTSIIAVMTVFYAVGLWNNWFDALIYLTKSDMAPLQLVLRNILIKSQATSNMMTGMDANYAEKQKVTEMIKFASIVVASVPMLIIYPFVQKYFSKGVMIGAVKG